MQVTRLVMTLNKTSCKLAAKTRTVAIRCKNTCVQYLIAYVNRGRVDLNDPGARVNRTASPLARRKIIEMVTR